MQISIKKNKRISSHPEMAKLIAENAEWPVKRLLQLLILKEENTTNSDYVLWVEQMLVILNNSNAMTKCIQNQ